MYTRNSPPEARANCILISVILLVMIILAITLGLVMSRNPYGPPQWRIAITNWPGFDNLYIAQEKGFFKQNGLTIELIPVNSMTDMRTAFERGIIDGYTGTVMDTVESIHDTRVPARIVLLTDYSDGGDVLLADPSITTVEDLRGKRVSMEVTSPAARYILNRALQGSSLTVADLDLRPYSQTIMTDHTIRHNLDAALTYEPFASQILAKRPMKRLFDTADIPGEILDILVVTPAMLTAEENLSQRLQQAWQNAIDYSNTHPEEVAAIMAKRYGITPEDYKTMAEGSRILGRTEIQRFASLNGLQQLIWKASNILNPQSPLSREEISRTSAVWYQTEAR